MMIIDRIEGEYAAVEMDGEMVNIPLAELPLEVKEGDILVKTDSGWQIDAQAVQVRREALAARRHRMLGGEDA